MNIHSCPHSHTASLQSLRSSRVSTHPHSFTVIYSHHCLSCSTKGVKFPAFCLELKSLDCESLSGVSHHHHLFRSFVWQEACLGEQELFTARYKTLLCTLVMEGKKEWLYVKWNSHQNVTKSLSVNVHESNLGVNAKLERKRHFRFSMGVLQALLQ